MIEHKKDGQTPRQRLLTLPEERLSKLLDPAEEEFAAEGFSGASLNRILARAAMSKGQAYYYIKSKADLYDAVIERAFGRFISALDFTFGEPINAEDFWEQVYRFSTRISEVLIADRRLAVLGQGLYESEITRAALPQTLVHARFEALIKLGQSLGAVRNDLPNSLLMRLLFAQAAETDRWFAEHWQTLNPDEAMRLNTITVRMLHAIASPTKGETS